MKYLIIAFVILFCVPFVSFADDDLVQAFTLSGKSYSGNSQNVSKRLALRMFIIEVLNESPALKEKILKISRRISRYTCYNGSLKITKNEKIGIEKKATNLLELENKKNENRFFLDFEARLKLKSVHCFGGALSIKKSFWNINFVFKNNVFYDFRLSKYYFMSKLVATYHF